MMEFFPEIRVVCSEDGGPVIHRGDAVYAEYVTEAAGAEFLEYHANITNLGNQPVFLNKVILLHTGDLSVFGIGPEPYLIYRSGRHKNDMPGLFETGCPDERLKDVSSVMAESGDGMAAAEGHCVVSDHLTLIRGKSDRCLALEFITGRDQLFRTCIRLNETGDFESLSAEVQFQIRLDPGETVRTETLRIAVTDDPEQETETFAERKAELYGRRNSRRPAVFCTWYYYGLTVTCEDVLRNLEAIRKNRLPYDVFQLDEGWEVTLGEYEPNRKFPVSMKEVADRIREAGFTPGLWSSPFVAHASATVWKEHPEWILRNGDGKPCLFPMNDTVYYVFDITNEDTYDYFRKLYRRFTCDWGYTYHKLDFTRAAVIYEEAAFSNRNITMARAYYQAVRAIREGMGEDAFLVMCGGLYDPVIGLVDAQRTGSDVLSMWSSSINRDGKTAPYTIRQSLERFYMNRWWANDPDALMIRRNERMERGLRLTYGLLNDDEVKTCLVNQFAGGGIMCQTEPMDKMDPDRMMEIRHILPVTESVTRLPDILSGERFPGTADVYFPKTGAHCICLINWSDTEDRRAVIHLADLPLDPEGEYVVCDFYSGMYRTGVRAGETVEFPSIRPHAAAVIKVEKRQKKPVIIASDGHYSMGAECSRLDISEGRLRVTRKGIPGAATRYLILLPEGWLVNGEETAELTVGPDEDSAEIQVSRAGY